MNAQTATPTALITGASAGLGRALATALAGHGWQLVLTARTADELALVASELSHSAQVVVRAGDVADSAHRDDLARLVREWAGSRLDLLVHNASTLGPTPLRPLRDLVTSDLERVLLTNAVAPHALTRALLPMLEATGGIVISISSDAAIEHYETWGAYGASKATLDHLTLTLGAELGGIRAYAVDPGDMRTAMQQAAFPGEDIGDRPLPEAVAVPGLLALLEARPASGRYRAADLVDAGVAS